MTNLGRISKNEISVDHLKLACRHVVEMMDAGLTENFAIRLLELFADSYARHCAGTKKAFAPFAAKNVDLWSRKARQLKRAKPDLFPKDHLRVEHGTPRREFARMVLDHFKKKRLTDSSMKALVRKYWSIAVITIEEDRALNKVARSKMMDTPMQRWKAAGIKF